MPVALLMTAVKSAVFLLGVTFSVPCSFRWTPRLRPSTTGTNNGATFHLEKRRPRCSPVSLIARTQYAYVALWSSPLMMANVPSGVVMMLVVSRWSRPSSLNWRVRIGDVLPSQSWTSYRSAWGCQLLRE